MKKLFVFLLIIATCFTCICCSEQGAKRVRYSIDYYKDTIDNNPYDLMETINNNIILTTVCSEENGNVMSISTLNLGKDSCYKNK